MTTLYAIGLAEIEFANHPNNPNLFDILASHPTVQQAQIGFTDALLDKVPLNVRSDLQHASQHSTDLPMPSVLDLLEAIQLIAHPCQLHHYLYG